MGNMPTKYEIPNHASGGLMVVRPAEMVLPPPTFGLSMMSHDRLYCKIPSDSASAGAGGPSGAAGGVKIGEPFVDVEEFDNLYKVTDEEEAATQKQLDTIRDSAPYQKFMKAFKELEPEIMKEDDDYEPEEHQDVTLKDYDGKNNIKSSADKAKTETIASTTPGLFGIAEPEERKSAGEASSLLKKDFSTWGMVNSIKQDMAKRRVKGFAGQELPSTNFSKRTSTSSSWNPSYVSNAGNATRMVTNWNPSHVSQASKSTYQRPKFYSKEDQRDKTSIRNQGPDSYGSNSGYPGSYSGGRTSFSKPGYGSYNNNRGGPSYGGYNDRPSYNRGGSYGSGYNNYNRFNSISEVGSTLTAPDWKSTMLTPFQKNFYTPHPNIVNRSDNDVNEYRKEKEISVSENAPRPIQSFEEANFPDNIMDEVKKQGFDNPTPIQAQGWPIAMSGQNMVGVAQTGSGKTLADTAQQRLRSKIEDINRSQRIRNFEGQVVTQLTTIFIIQAHKRTEYLKELIQSLKSVKNINTTILVFSHDFFSDELNEIVNSIDFAPVLQIFFPFSNQIYPNEFPGTSPNDCKWDLNVEEARLQGCQGSSTPDEYGHFRQSEITQSKHHWWWKINTVFDKLEVTKNFDGYVLFLEEDHYVATDALHVLRLMIELAAVECPQCNSFHIGNFKNSNSYKDDAHKVDVSQWNNLGLSFNRTLWNVLKECSNVFCTFDDYNWDWSFKFASEQCFNQKLTPTVVRASRVFHIGDCGMHHHGGECSLKKSLVEAQVILNEAKPYLFPDTIVLETMNLNQQTVKKGWGGWADPRDIQLCINISNSVIGLR